MKKKTSMLIIIALVIIIASLLGVIIKLTAPKEQKSGGIVYEPYNEEDEEPKELPGIVIPGWTAIKLPAGKLEAEVSLHNPKENQGYYDLNFILKLVETDEVIFDTGKIEPGYQCSQVTLTRELEPGEYKAIMVVQPYLKDEQQSPTNNADLEIKLIVE